MSQVSPLSSRQTLAQRFRRTRLDTEALTETLTPEDMGAQSMTDASPTKWHLAHTTWFFATFLPLELESPGWVALFNSYYQTLGHPFPRSKRGLLTRPRFDEVMDWRAEVTEAVVELIDGAADEDWPKLVPLVSLGIAHEQQHQELILTDILHLFAQNPLAPAFRPYRVAELRAPTPLEWIDYPGGVVEIGHAGGDGFAFDNEGPRHPVYLAPWRLASRLVTNGEYLAFIKAGGYRRAEFWLSDGWATAQEQGWIAPLYWRWQDHKPFALTLAGVQPLDPAAPVCHVSYYEADAYARWAHERLPTEVEWETAAAAMPVAGNDLGSGLLRPLPAVSVEGVPAQMFGDLWEWTASPYTAYPGYKPGAGALGEYNGKFMVNQMVLRGGSCVTPANHLRASYRNFFPPNARWQFAGLRLAEDG